jgi:hypothetical protein
MGVPLLLASALLAFTGATSAVAQTHYLGSEERGYAVGTSYALSRDVMGLGVSLSYSPDARLELGLAGASFRPTTSSGGWGYGRQTYQALGAGAAYLVVSQREREPFDLQIGALYQLLTTRTATHAFSVTGALSRTITEGEIIFAPELGVTFTPIALSYEGSSDRPLLALNVGGRAASRLGRDILVVLGPSIAFSGDEIIFAATLGVVGRIP